MHRVYTLFSQEITSVRRLVLPVNHQVRLIAALARCIVVAFQSALFSQWHSSLLPSFQQTFLALRLNFCLPLKELMSSNKMPLYLEDYELWSISSLQHTQCKRRSPRFTLLTELNRECTGLQSDMLSRSEPIGVQTLNFAIPIPMANRAMLSPGTVCTHK